jgi:hypothetical protein
VGANPERLCFVSREESQKVLDACPDAEWRLLFALSRYGGLRCPSEHLALRWGDVDWERSRFTVRSPKTFPLHVVVQWIGNPQPIALKHYLSVREEDLALAIAGDGRAAQKAAGDPAQYPAGSARTGKYEEAPITQNRPDLPSHSESYDTIHSPNCPRWDSNTPPILAEKPGIPQRAAQNPAHLATIQQAIDNRRTPTWPTW